MKCCYLWIYHIEFKIENQLLDHIISEKKTIFRWFMLSGPLHAGKTSFLKHLVLRLQEQGMCMNGVLSLAQFQGGERTGYDAMDLQSGSTFPLLRCRSEAEWLKVGSYGVHPEGLKKAEQAIQQIQDSDLTIIDEIGPLELAGSGFWPSFCKLRQKNQPTLIVVREPLVLQLEASCSKPDIHFKLQTDGLETEMVKRLTELKTP